jgi:phospholipase/carboxylesterase
MDEDRFAAVLQPLFDLPLHVLIPRAPFPMDVRSEHRIGASWYAYDGDAARFAFELQRTEELLLGLLHAVERERSLRPRSRLLLGYSQGGYCGAPCALRHPELFEGLIVIGARVKTEILGDVLPDAARHGTRVLLVHGRDDAAVPFEFAERSQAELGAAGITTTLRAAPGGHALDAAQLELVHRWLAVIGR